MIKDLELMKDITPLFTKKIVMWGMGKNGRKIMKEIVDLCQGKQELILCDSNSKLWGKYIDEFMIYSPEEAKNLLSSIDLDEFMIVVTVCSVQIQEEIIKEIYNMYGTSVNLCTEFAVKWGIYLGLNNPYIDEKYKKIKLIERKNACISQQERKIQEIVNYFEQVQIYDDEIILVYQPGKVASTTIYKSIQGYGRHVLHCHTFDGVEETDLALYEILDSKSVKIICIVREPIGRQIATMWQNIDSFNRYSAQVDFQEIEQYYFKNGFENEEYDWFNNEIRRHLDINVFEYHFNQEKGYSIINKGNMELLLMKMERINELESVMGKFLEIENFKLKNSNIGMQKLYRYAMQSFKDNINFAKETLEKIYNDNEFVKYFYTEEERKDFIKNWMKSE